MALDTLVSQQPALYDTGTGNRTTIGNFVGYRPMDNAVNVPNIYSGTNVAKQVTGIKT